jgi:phage terminase small subunit
MKGLTNNQELFCQELMKGKSQRQAYLAAYPRSQKWKPESVDREASILKKKPKVSQRIEELREEQLDDVSKIRNTIIDTYETILKANIGDYYTTDIDEQGNITLNVVDLQKVDTRAIQEISFVNGGKVKIKLYSKTDASKGLENLLGLNEQKVDAEVSIKIEDNFEGMCD